MKPSTNLEKLFLRNYRFIGRYICGNHRIDSRLVSKFINEFPPKAADVKLYRAEVQSLSGKKNKKRLMSASAGKFSAAKGCVSMLKHRNYALQQPTEINETKLNIYEIKNPEVLLDEYEIGMFADWCNENYRLPGLSIIETYTVENEREFIIKSTAEKILVDEIDLSLPEYNNIASYE